MNSISATTLKTRGAAALASALGRESEVAVSVRGRHRYVVMAMERYRQLRECELAAAHVETTAELASGNFIAESVAAHLARVTGRS